MKTRHFTSLLFVSLLAYAGVCPAQPCPATVTLIAPLANATLMEQAGRYLSATNCLQSGNVSYRAGQSIALASGFEVKPGAVFEASIANCAAIEAARSDQDSPLVLSAYPNPFANNTLIEYTLPNTTTASLTITNLQGIVVSRLIVEEAQSEGTHRVTFESANLPDGVYVCTLDTPLRRRSYRIVKQK